MSGLLVHGSSTVVLLATGLLIFHSFRERYLLSWLGGWAAYLVYRVVALAGPSWWPARVTDAVSDSAFVIAVTFFVASVLHYTNSRRLLLPLAAVAALTLDLAVVRTLWRPESTFLWYALMVLYRTMTITAAVRLALFSRGRRALGPWILCATLLLLHLDESPSTHVYWAAFDVIAEVLLGASMLLIVLDDSKAHNRRLDVINSIASAIAEASDCAPMLACALRELKGLTGARAAWVRLLEGDKLVIVQQIGLSAQFLENRAQNSMIVAAASRT